jgi:hypothetical protein
MKPEAPVTKTRMGILLEAATNVAADDEETRHSARRTLSATAVEGAAELLARGLAIDLAHGGVSSRLFSRGHACFPVLSPSSSVRAALLGLHGLLGDDLPNLHRGIDRQIGVRAE